MLWLGIYGGAIVKTRASVGGFVSWCSRLALGGNGSFRASKAGGFFFYGISNSSAFDAYAGK